MSDEAPNNQWLADAIKGAKASALPRLVRETLINDRDENGDERPSDEVDDEVMATVDAIELALLSITGDVTQEKIRNALRSVAELYASSIGTPWENVADAILGQMEWLPADPSTHVLNSWGGR